jgi:hypothetical protein
MASRVWVFSLHAFCMNGWIKLHRQFMEWEWYTDQNVKAVFLHCLLSANIVSKEWRGVNIDRGSFITSISKLAIDTGLSVKAVRIALDKLKKTSEIMSEGASHWTKISICKYDTYQLKDDDEGQTKGKPKGKLGANKGQTKGKLRATTKEEEELLKRKEGEEIPTGSVSGKTGNGNLNFPVMIKIFTDWYESEKVVGVKYPFQGSVDGQAMVKIISYLEKAIKEKNGRPATDQEIQDGWMYILENYHRWDNFTQRQLKLSQVSANMANILTSIKKGNGNSKTATTSELNRIYDETRAIVDQFYSGK